MPISSFSIGKLISSLFIFSFFISSSSLFSIFSFSPSNSLFLSIGGNFFLFKGWFNFSLRYSTSSISSFWLSSFCSITSTFSLLFSLFSSPICSSFAFLLFVVFFFFDFSVFFVVFVPFVDNFFFDFDLSIFYLCLF